MLTQGSDIYRNQKKRTNNGSRKERKREGSLTMKRRREGEKKVVSVKREKAGVSSGEGGPPKRTSCLGLAPIVVWGTTAAHVM